MSIKIECDPKQVVEASTDRRGRFTLGSEYADKNVTVLVVETEES